MVLFGTAFGIVGFVDDYIKVVKKRNLGLTEKQKELLREFAKACGESNYAKKKGFKKDKK